MGKPHRRPGAQLKAAPNAQVLSFSELKRFTLEDYRVLDTTYLIIAGGEPVAALVPIQEFLLMTRLLEQLKERLT